MSKRRVKRRKRRARVNIMPLILAGVVIAGVITVVMNVKLKGADKEIHITETPRVENTEPVMEQEVYEDGFRYYEIPQEYKDAGGCFPEIVQVYLWCECKKYGVDYYTVLALIERESGYHSDKLGDNGNSKGYMQIYEKWHTKRMEAEGVTDLFNPYQNIRVGLNCLREIQDKYLASSGENCVLMVYNMGESTAKKLWAKDIYSSAYSREVIARAQELRQELTQE